MSAVRSLLIILHHPLELFCRQSDVGEVVTCGDKRFCDAGLGDWIGFYDWLRTADGRVIGLRSWIELSELRSLGALPAVNEALEFEEGCLHVWFSDLREFDEEKSDDQDLGTHRLMRSDDGVLALGVSTESLSKNDCDELCMHAERPKNLA
jgi:hypothetical protein